MDAAADVVVVADVDAIVVDVADVAVARNQSCQDSPQQSMEMGQDNKNVLAVV